MRALAQNTNGRDKVNTEHVYTPGKLPSAGTGVRIDVQLFQQNDGTWYIYESQTCPKCGVKRVDQGVVISQTEVTVSLEHGLCWDCLYEEVS